MTEQITLPLFGRNEGAAIAPTALVLRCRTYREAVRMCWQYRRVKRMTIRQLAAEGEFYAQHVGDWLNPDDLPKRRSLPGDSIPAFEAVAGNCIVSQWIAAQSRLTVLEEMQASRLAA